MDKQLIIAVSREFGSGGHVIAEELAKRFDLPLYDSSLLRKIKTLFDMPPLDFIRLIRLKKAADLIQDGRYRMGEISLKVGFSNHSYFSKLFCRQFGMTPKDFEKQIQEQRSKTKDLRQ